MFLWNLGLFNRGAQASNALGVSRQQRVSSVDIPLVAAVLAQVVQVVVGIVFGHAAVGHDDLFQGALHVTCHAVGITADIEVCTFLQPLPDIGSGLCQAVLHVDLLLALA